MRKKLEEISEKYHGLVHVMLGGIIGVVIFSIQTTYGPIYLIGIGIIGNLFPDVDHLFSWYIYARNTEYSKKAREYVKNLEFKKLFEFSLRNHKYNCSIYSHNILTFIIFITAGIVAFSYESYILAVFMISASFHFVYDMLEDILYFGKLNTNWFLKFKKPEIKHES